MDNIKDLGKVCITPEGAWDINKQYERLALVTGLEPDPLNPAVEQVVSYVSRKNVPAGSITLNNKEYWQKFTNKVTWEDLYVGDDGWIYIGDTPIYELKLNDILGDIVVEKIEQGLTEKIMQAITTYMGGVVSNFVDAITSQIDRLIAQGIKVNNQHSGTINNKLSGSVAHSGAMDINHGGEVELAHTGRLKADISLSGGIDVNGGVTPPTPVTMYTLVINTTPSDASVTLNGDSVRSGEFEENTPVEVVVEKPGYVTHRRIIIVDDNITENIVLEEIPVIPDVYTFDVNPRSNNVNANGGIITLTINSLKNGNAYDNYNAIKTSDINNIIESITGNKIIIKKNNDTVDKNATVTYKQYDANNNVKNEVVISILQTAADTPQPPEPVWVLRCDEYPDGSRITFPASGGIKNIHVVSTCDGETREALIGQGSYVVDFGWGKIERVNSNNDYKITIYENTSYEENDYTLRIVQVGHQSNTLLWTIVQAGKDQPQPDEYILDIDIADLDVDSSDTEPKYRNFVSTKNGVYNEPQISVSENWISAVIEPEGNIKKLKITVEQNLDTESRSGAITLVNGTETRIIIVNQDGSTPPTQRFTINVDPITQGATVVMNGIEGYPQTFDSGENITVVISKQGFETKTESVTNLNADTTINGVLTPIQDEYTLEITTKEFTFDAQDEYKQTSFISTKNGNYNRPTVTVYDDLPWIHYNIIDNEANKYIRITVDNNTLTSERNGVIIVTNGDKEERITIRQNGLDLPYTFEVNPDRHENISANGQNGLESVVTSKRGTEDVNWYIEQNPQYNFITNVRKDGNKVKFDVPENTAFDSRSDSITVVQERPEGNAFIYLIVQQKARTEEFSANPDDFYLSEDGDNKTSTIISTINGVAVNWTVENTPSWCNAERNGNILNISVGQNLGAQRNGTITLKQTGTQNTITIQVTQNGELVEFVFTRRIPGEGDYGPFPIDEISVDFNGNMRTEIIIIPRVIINDLLTDNVAEISQFGLVDGDIDKFTLEKIANVDGKYEALRILTNGAAPQSGDYYTSLLQFDVEYNGRTVNIEKDVDWSN